MWIPWTNPVGMLSLQLIPDPICQVRVEQTIWVETIASFNQVFWVASFLDPPLDHLLGWEIVVSNVKILELVVLNDFLVDFCEISGSLGGKSPYCCICVEPSPARTDVEAVKEVVHL